VQSEGKPERDSTACYQSDGPTEIDPQRYQSADRRCGNCYWWVIGTCVLYQVRASPISTCKNFKSRISGEVHDGRTPPADW
jgi:hypothetical protein